MSSPSTQGGSCSGSDEVSVFQPPYPRFVLVTGEDEIDVQVLAELQHINGIGRDMLLSSRSRNGYQVVVQRQYPELILAVSRLTSL